MKYGKYDQVSFDLTFKGDPPDGDGFDGIKDARRDQARYGKVN